MSKRRRRGLSADDLELWQSATRTMRPLQPDRPAFLAPKMAPEMPEPASPPKGKQPSGPATFRIGERAPPGSKGQTLRHQPDLAMDAKTHKKMLRGKLKPDAKIDLHGMTLAEAHPELVAFIHRCCHQGFRLVLVVTGKGRDRDEDGPIPTPRGVLRHHVPGWLRSPGMRPLVLQITDAHQRHGGSGAYYVYLRRRG